MRRALVFWLWWSLPGGAFAETIPPRPAAYFNDYAGVVSAPTAQRLDEELRQFERDSSNQIVVAVFPKMDSDSSVQDYTYRVAQSWQVGQKGRNNGAVLFVFTEAHSMFIQVGYGLEGALPDITCKQIIENEIKPAFRTGNLDAGLAAGVDAMIKAARGEYHGTGSVKGDRLGAGPQIGMFFFLVLALIVFQILQTAWRGTVYSRRGRGVVPGVWGGSGFGGGSWGGGSSGGGGGFSGGGGSFGGGGAGGSW